MISENPRLNSPEIAEKILTDLSVVVAPRTIRNFLHSVGYENRIACKKPLLSSKNVVKRLEFAGKYILMPNEFWENVNFLMRRNSIYLEMIHRLGCGGKKENGFLKKIYPPP